MVQHRFETVTRAVSGGSSRRAVLRGLPGVGGALAALRPPDAVAAKRKKKRRKKRKPALRCDVCRSGCAFTSLQEAVDAADPEAAIRLCPGAYRGRISVDKNLTLIGAGRKRSTLDSGGVAGTTAVLTVGSGATVTVRALTVKGGNGGDGGGIFNEGTLTLEGVNVTANHADKGGGIVNRTGGLTLADCRVSGNEAGSQGGGLFLLGGAVTLNDSHVTANKTGLNGGGMFVNGGAVTLNGSQVTGNKALGAGSEGGGLKIISGAVTLNGSPVTGNTAAAGGGIYNVDGTISVDPESVTGNTPDNCAGKAVGNCAN